MIRLRNITKKFNQNKDEIIALRDINLFIEKGEWINILGPSGSGKTTLLNLISGMDAPTAGTITVGEFDLAQLSEKEKRRYRRNYIGYIFQDFRLLPQYTVLENTMLPLIPYQPHGLKEKAMQILKNLGLEHRLNQTPEQLSGGEKQRTAIARALINDPPILLCDEPTGNLDAGNRDIIVEILNDLSKRGKTILLVTHDPELAKNGYKRYDLRDGVLRESVPR